MLKLFKRFLFTALRISAIVFVISLCLISLNRCCSESKDEPITVLNINSSFTFENHVDQIPVKTIVSNSNVEENVDIVHFGTTESFTNYSEEFEALESVSVHKKIPICLYLPRSIYSTDSRIEISFESLIDGIINNKNWSDLIKYADKSPILLNYDVSNETGYAFYTLLFDYFSDGKASDRLSSAEREDVINKMKNFIKEHPSTLITANNKDNVASFYKSTDYYKLVYFSKDVVLETKFFAVTETGKKYLSTITEQYLNDQNLANANLVSCENLDVINAFMETDVTPFEHQSSMESKEGEIIARVIWGIFSGFTMLLFPLFMEEDYDLRWIDTDVIAGSAFTGIACIFSPNVIVFIGAGIGWFIFALYADEWFTDCRDCFSETLGEYKRLKEEKAKAAQKSQEMLKKIGEDNADVYKNISSLIDEMIWYNEKLGVKPDVWKDIKKFLVDNPSSISKISSLFDTSVRLMLEVLEELPKDEQGNIKTDFERLARIKTLLDGINQVTADNFKDKKKWHHMDMDASLNIIEANLKNKINLD